MLSCTAAPYRAYRPVPSITGVRFICARMYTGSGLELFAIAVVCKEVCISNSCPIFTLAAEQVVIHCITTAHQNAKLVSISSSRADRSYTFSLYFAHREQVQNCTLLTASEYRRSCKGAPQHCTLLTASKCKLS